MIFDAQRQPREPTIADGDSQEPQVRQEHSAYRGDQGRRQAREALGLRHVRSQVQGQASATLHVSHRPKRRRAHARQAALLSVLFALLVVAHAWAFDASIKDVATSPERFDGKSISLRGNVANLQRRVSAKGNAYFTFDLSDGSGSVRVFSFGQTSCKPGDEAAVDGQFDQVKRVGRYTFRNEVTATRVVCR